MHDKPETERLVGCEQRTTLVYDKRFAVLGMICGVVMIFGTWFSVFIVFAGMSLRDRQWTESLPAWTVPTVFCIGMGGGVLLMLASTIFGLLTPSRVIREGPGNETPPEGK